MSVPNKRSTCRPLPSQEVLWDLLRYDPKTGKFTNRKNRAGGSRRGEECGTSFESGGRGNKKEYIVISINGGRFLAHRLAWKYMTGEDPEADFIDHKDGNGLNNIWWNLRRASHSENCHNQQRLPVFFHKVTGKWWVRIMHKSIYYNGGLFPDKESATSAALFLKAEIHGNEFNPHVI